MRKLLVLAVVGAGISLVLLPRIRAAATGGWQDLLEANHARRSDMRDRVHSATGHHVDSAALAAAGIQVVTETLSVPADSAAPPRSWWSATAAKLREWLGGPRAAPSSSPADTPATVPPLADSLGLRPGDRVFLPDGRSVPAESLSALTAPVPGP